MKTYKFEIRTVKVLSDPNSPHKLCSFEFLAENKSQAMEFQQKLIAAYESNKPFTPSMPRETSQLIEEE